MFLLIFLKQEGVRVFKKQVNINISNSLEGYMRHYIVTSDNYSGVLMTEQEYKKTCAEMSTGDYNSHSIEIVDINLSEDVKVVGFDRFKNESKEKQCYANDFEKIIKRNLQNKQKREKERYKENKNVIREYRIK